MALSPLATPMAGLLADDTVGSSTIEKHFNDDSGVSSLKFFWGKKFWGLKYLIFGEQQYFYAMPLLQANNY